MKSKLEQIGFQGYVVWFQKIFIPTPWLEEVSKAKIFKGKND